MTNRESVKAVLNYQNYDRMPVIHFGYWPECYAKWIREGRLNEDEARLKGLDLVRAIAGKQGFDFGWHADSPGDIGLRPAFAKEVRESLPDGTRKVRQADGAIVLEHPDLTAIPSEIDHTLKDRASWETEYLPRLQFAAERLNAEALRRSRAVKDALGEPHGVHCGSAIGTIRNWLGVTGLSYLWVDDPKLLEEIVHTVADLAFACLRGAVEAVDFQFDYGDFWEDICFKTGPLVAPPMFNEFCGWVYRRATDFLKAHGVTLFSVDCDGMIDSLVPTWLENGVNVMFPVEVGTWNASIAPWRQRYGQQIRAVGGVNKKIFAHDRTAVDAEIERLKPLVDLGGFIPCPDHLIPIDAKWELVQYYCERVRKTFSR